MSIGLIAWRWDGEALRPLPHFAATCNRELVVGDIYRLPPVEQRSEASHNQFFASLHEKWESLPDHLAMDFPNDQILRKHALCMTGFRNERKFACSSPEEARKLAAWLKPRFMDQDNYAIISVHENVVVEWTPVSQSRRAMPEKGRFQDSKQAVLDWIDDLLGVNQKEEPHQHQNHTTENPPRRSMPPAGEAPPLVPDELTDRERELLRKLNQRCDDLRREADLDDGAAKFRQHHRIAADSPFDQAVSGIIAAHRSRICGESSPVDAEREAQRVMA